MNHNYLEYNSNSTFTPIIVLHGWGGSLQSLTPLSQHLSKLIYHPIYNLELPGFGDTKMTKDVMDTESYAQYVNDFIEAHNLEKIILVGHSFGGKTSIKFTLEYPEKVEKLILINPSGIKPRNSIKKTVFKTVSLLAPSSIKNSKIIRTIFYKKIVKENDYLNAKVLKKSLSKIVNEHYDNVLKEINCTTLLIWSEKDSYVPLWMGELMNSHIPNSKLEIVEGETHGLPLTNPEKTANIISVFLKINR